MQVICVIGRSPKGNSETIPSDQMAAEADYVRACYIDGVVRQIWSRGDVGGAVLLLEAADLEDARAVVSRLPLMQSGFLQVDSIVPLKPYRAFGPSV